MQKILVFTKPGCRQCKMTKRKLNELGKDFEEVNVMEDENALSHVKELGYQALPVIEFGETVFQGFRPDQLEKLG